MKKERNLNSLRCSDSKFLHQVIRVNHAGEYGAICVYSGQRFVLKKSSIINKIIEMEEQEKKHFHYFNGKIKEQKVRPTVLLPVWCVLGVSLGVVTAIMGKKAAMACTAAVEEVIGEHYREQVSHLEDGELKETISRFRDEELEHRDIAIEHNAESALGYNVLSSFIKTGCKAAIYFSKLI
ncbi:demethoxyubiquinone hydroxylase family protein [Wolbachia endosymbiont of Litomosoides brasiliensis]|uniref:demethoxyubiquinone hydroxylase family protein n=1 Tax=Wolbachia endosymbiont of Litomosoides brasiliensis TaxID=1812117 RepID=UPI00158D2DB1|nr:demethoxyubiquinone hydroxylase family protein [Wolbachia endosymbiont of Litomosoides brasiliensis]